ncbi:hypothetical protein [Bosea sp. MMO-172]|uniref:hypothetical protein n=1 Tax=Bosea sp. MMO-172 TaxID=3127885 RepID=UPI003019F5AE
MTPRTYYELDPGIRVQLREGQLVISQDKSRAKSARDSTHYVNLKNMDQLRELLSAILALVPECEGVVNL